MLISHAIALILAGIGFLALILGLIMKRRLRERYALIWLFFGLAVIFLPLIYSLLSWVNGFLDLPHTTILIIGFVLAGLTLICLQLSVAISSLWKKQKELIQYIALLELQIKEKK